MTLDELYKRIRRLYDHITTDGVWFIPGVDPNTGPTNLPVYTQASNLHGQTVLVKVADLQVNVSHIMVNFVPGPTHFADQLLNHLAHFKG